MAFPQGINFRSTAAFVTDPTGTDAERATTAYPWTTAQGTSVGWVSLTNISGNTRDRSAALDPRLAGIHFVTGANTADYRIDLPAAGTYTISLALGDNAGGYNCGVDLQIKDGVTVLTTLGPTGGTNAVCNAGQWTDATGTARTSAADWVANQASASLTFSGTSAVFSLIGQSGKNSPISHINIAAAGGGPSPISGALSQTLADATLSSAATVKLAAALSQTLADASLSSAAKLSLAAALSATLEDASLSSAGSGVTTTIGSLAATLASATLSSAATLQIQGALTAALADVTLSAEGALKIAGALTRTLDDASLSAASTIGPISAALDVTLEGVAILARGRDPNAEVTTVATDLLWKRRRRWHA